ncbi:hypothetical protein [Sphingomonas sp. BK580]|uniref:hypothetical protein n=1 Tax=Sphingomonas sp. BK580 TaxID=2586972 RepID=UPI00160BC93E|nr:hypothetical protein [Sphingomonas sp. BK580]MBB3695876.1 hypothetical protein [Sphingomonas sp. BK580]
MPEEEADYHWDEDPYWTTALDRFRGIREADQPSITLDLAAVEEAVFRGDIAYRLMQAMASVKEHEGWEGHRGAPRLALALVQLLSEAAPPHLPDPAT